MLRVSFALGSVSVFAAADHGAEGGGYYTPYLVPCGGSLWYGFEHLGPFLVRKSSLLIKRNSQSRARLCQSKV